MLGAALNVAHLRFKDLVRAQVSYVHACVSCGTGSGPVIVKSSSALYHVDTTKSLPFAQELRTPGTPCPSFGTLPRRACTRCLRPSYAYEHVMFRTPFLPHVAYAWRSYTFAFALHKSI